MENKLDCGLVRDLLPSYAEGLTGEASNRAVEAHLADCPACTEALRRMREPEPPAPAAPPEVDYLKKVRRHTARTGLLSGLVLLAAGLLLLFVRFFLIGSRAEPEAVSAHAAVDGAVVTVSGTVKGAGVARVVFEESAGVVNVVVYTAPGRLLNGGEFAARYEANAPVDGVRCGDTFLWANGLEIGPTASALYAACNPFVGDMPANSRVAAVLGVAEQFGPFTSELQTEVEPYGWTLLLETPIAAEDESAARAIMTADSCAMLAVIENLGSVSWNYETEAGAAVYTITADGASRLAGRDIKRCADSPDALQSLLQSLSLRWSGVREELQEDGVFRLRIRNGADTGAYALAIDYFLDGELIGSRGMSDAGGHALAAGEETVFEFLPEDFPEDTSAAELAGFSFKLYVTAASGQTQVCDVEAVDAKYAWTYDYTLCGDFAGGFFLNEG